MSQGRYKEPIDHEYTGRRKNRIVVQGITGREGAFHTKQM